MSEMRLCDRCGKPFSVLTEGWQTFSGTTFNTNPLTGERRQITLPMDACANCAMVAPGLQVESPLERLVRKIEERPELADRLLAEHPDIVTNKPGTTPEGGEGT